MRISLKFHVLNNIDRGKPPRFSLRSVKSNISRLFKADADKTAQLFYGKPIVIKKNLGEDSSKKYLSILNKAGAVIQQVPVQSTTSPVETISQTQ